MSADQLSPNRGSIAGDTTIVQYDHYIDAHIRSIRRAVKLVDLATALVLFFSGVLAFLLAVALVEHWLVPGGFSMAVRTLLFAALAGGAGYFAYRRLWPLCVRAINPVYAARTIEQSSPSLKNTLVNLLLFRQRRGEVSDAVYHTLEEQAAQRLTRVPVDSAVDRGQLIRFGYVLVAVVALAAIYKIASPKDPFITAERVLFPWADIVPASRVQITAINPGDVTIPRGEFINVAAEVRGISEDDPVVLRYSTADGQAIGQAIPMQAAADGVHYECRLPDRTDAIGQLGLSQNLNYRIEAGDARSLDYDVTVVTAPAILVQKIEYDYPAYTGYVDRTVEGLGDIRAIEGTRITVFALANGPIRDALVDFDADGRRDLPPMIVDGANAKTSFVLSLRDDRQTPKFASYVLRFTNGDGRTNRNPVKYPIEVLRDYDPEVALVTPPEETLDVRLDQTVTIEIDARDPDFALSDVHLRGEAVGRPELNETLLQTQHIGRFTAQYPFTPKDHGLQAGDALHYWATASDNRTPTANTAATRKQTIRIVAPDAARQPFGDNQNDSRQPTPNRNQPQQKQQPGDHSQDPRGKQDPNAGGDNTASSAERGRAGDNSQPQPGRNSDPGRDHQPSKDEPMPRGGGESAESQPGASQQQDDRTGQAGDSQGQQSDSSNKQDNQEQPGAGAAGGTGNNQRSQPSGARPDSGGKPGASNDDSEGDNNSRNDGDSPGNPRSDSRPISSKGDNDADAFRKIQEHLKRTGELNNDASQKDAAKNDGGPHDGMTKQQDGTNQKNGPQNDSTAKNPGATQSDRDPQSGATAQNGAAGQDGAQRNSAQQSDASKADKANPTTQQNDPQSGNGAGKSNDGKNQSPDNNANSMNADKQPSAARGAGGERRGGTSDKQPTDTGTDGKQSDGKRDDGRPSRGGDATSTDPSGKSTSPSRDEGTRNSQKDPGDQSGEKWQQNPSTEQTADQSKDGATGQRDANNAGDQGANLPKDSKDSVTNNVKDVNRNGDGATGQGHSADQSAGETGEHGPGNDSKNVGRDLTSPDKTGQRGNTAGRGSSQRDGTGNEPGGKAGESQAAKSDSQNKSTDPAGRGGGRSADQQAGDSTAKDSASNNNNNNNNNQSGGGAKEQDAMQKGDNSGGTRSSTSGKANPASEPGTESEKSSSPSGPPTNGARPSDPSNPSTNNTIQTGTPDGSGGQGATSPGLPAQATGEAPDADAANLEYARKQTDLVLEKLSEQVKNKQVDKDLLKSLGWSEDDLRKFIARWNERKEAASKTDPGADAARRELDDALKSLGLRPAVLKQNRVKDDTQRDMNQGYRGAVPLELQERLRAFNQGVSRSRREEGQK